MAKQVVYFNATKQIETITIHYNNKLDGTFIDDVSGYIKEVAKKMSKVDLKNPNEFDSIQVFVYPSKKLFNSVFIGEIEKRYYSGKRSTEDLYVVQDSEGNIHIVSPRGMAQEKREALKRILVMKILSQYMDEKQKQSANILLKELMKPKQEVIIEQEEEEIEQDTEQELEEPEEDLEELEDQTEEDLDEEDLDEIIETELVMEGIDDNENEENSEEKKENTRTEAQEWLNVGWFAYINGRLKKQADIKRFAENISKKGVIKLSKLSHGSLFENYNYSSEYACAWVEYIINTYGMKKFIEYYENPKDIRGVFGISKYIFESQVKAYIKEKYKDEEKVLKVAEDIKLDYIINQEKIEKDLENNSAIAELTLLRFSKSGGVDIVSVPEEKQVLEIKEKI